MGARTCFPVALALAAAVTATPAAADDRSAAKIAEQVCSDRKDASALTISRSRIAEQILRANQLYLDDLLPKEGSIIAKMQYLRTRGTTAEDAITQERISGAQLSIRDLETQLALGALENLTVTGVTSFERGWLFSDQAESAVFTCKKAKTTTILETIAAPPGRNLISLREKPEDLGLTGKDRKAASAFAIGLQKKWSTDANGVETEQTTLKFNGTAGLRLTANDSPLTSFAFAQYNLNQARKDPAPPLAAGVRRNKDDTNVLALGMNFDYFYYTGEAGDPTFWVTGQGAYVNDFVDESERVRISAKLDPGLLEDLGVCGLGRIKYLGKSTKFGARCLVRLDTEAGIWLSDGISTTRRYDDFVAAGVNLSYELYLELAEKTGVLASANYRYLPVLTGTLDDIERIELALSHRIWTDGNLGIEMLLRYNSGTNALSLAEEEDLSLGIGLIF